MSAVELLDPGVLQATIEGVFSAEAAAARAAREEQQSWRVRENRNDAARIASDVAKCVQRAINAMKEAAGQGGRCVEVYVGGYGDGHSNFSPCSTTLRLQGEVLLKLRELHHSPQLHFEIDYRDHHRDGRVYQRDGIIRIVLLDPPEAPAPA